VSPRDKEHELRQQYQALHRAWGAQHWWPAETQFEVIVGAYLTQNTAWTNVERALANLRAARVLSVEGIRNVRRDRLERLIQPSGYFRQKAKRLKTFVAFLDAEYGGSLDRLLSQPTDKLRLELLSLNGVGPETADSILLYAGNRPVFVVDAYTRRILARHEILSEETDYEDIRQLMERALTPLAREQRETVTTGSAGTLALPTEGPQGLNPGSSGAPSGTLRLAALTQGKLKTEAVPFPRLNHGTSFKTTGQYVESGLRGAAHPPSAMSMAKRTPLVQVYNEMHGLLVGVGKRYCGKSQPKCDGCPLQRFLPCGKQ